MNREKGDTKEKEKRDGTRTEINGKIPRNEEA